MLLTTLTTVEAPLLDHAPRPTRPMKHIIIISISDSISMSTSVGVIISINMSIATGISMRFYVRGGTFEAIGENINHIAFAVTIA